MKLIPRLKKEVKSELAAWVKAKHQEHKVYTTAYRKAKLSAIQAKAIKNAQGQPTVRGYYEQPVRNLWHNAAFWYGGLNGYHNNNRRHRIKHIIILK